jgi:hypothetical protein
LELSPRGGPLKACFQVARPLAERACCIGHAVAGSMLLDPGNGAVPGGSGGHVHRALAKGFQEVGRRAVASRKQSGVDL